MPATASLHTELGYDITPDGREALRAEEVCLCDSLVVYEGLYMCVECSTVYGVATLQFDYGRPPRPLRHRRARRGALRGSWERIGEWLKEGTDDELLQLARLIEKDLIERIKHSDAIGDGPHVEAMCRAARRVFRDNLVW